MFLSMLNLQHQRIYFRKCQISLNAVDVLSVKSGMKTFIKPANVHLMKDNRTKKN